MRHLWPLLTVGGEPPSNGSAAFSLCLYRKVSATEIVSNASLPKPIIQNHGLVFDRNLSYLSPRVSFEDTRRGGTVKQVQ